jgi:integrase
MASISNSPGGLRTIQFMAPDQSGKRKSIRLGKVSKRVAEEIKVKVEALVASKIAGLSWDGETARWVAALAPELAGKLAACGLIPKRQEAAAVQLGPFLAEHIAGRTDVKEGTGSNLQIGANRLTAYFGESRDLASITPGDCDEWMLRLKERYAPATVGRSVRWAKQFFRAALRKRLIAANPFEEVKAPGMGNEARKFFVSRAAALAVLDACPDCEWRLLFALSRYGGLRCPSEHHALQWTDVNWEQGRFRVTSPKTERHEGKAERWVPIFPELRPYLEEAFEQAPEGAVYVIARYRGDRMNLRTQLARIMRKAGLSPWPRLFQNLRASRETELAAEYPLHVVCAWIGNSQRIAAKHYLQITEDDWQRAAKSGAVGQEAALQNPVQQEAAQTRTDSQGSPNPVGACELVRDSALPFEDIRDSKGIPA